MFQKCDNSPIFRLCKAVLFCAHSAKIVEVSKNASVMFSARVQDSNWWTLPWLGFPWITEQKLDKTWTKASPWPDTACWKMPRDWETSLCFDTWPRASVCSQSECTLHRWWDMVRWNSRTCCIIIVTITPSYLIRTTPVKSGQYASLWAVNSASVFW